MKVESTKVPIGRVRRSQGGRCTFNLPKVCETISISQDSVAHLREVLKGTNVL
jgi:hypothetical protein